MNPIILDGRTLTPEKVVAIARHGAKVSLCPEAEAAMARAADLIAAKVAADEVVYGVTTGFGSNADKLLRDASHASALQRNLVISHAVGAGKPLAPEIVRALIVIRVNTLLRGHSGVRASTAHTLLAMLDADVLPRIPEKGSVGASGDLAPLSHMALALIGEGRVIYKGQDRLAREAMAEAGITPVELTYKEGLGLINGTALMLSFLTLALADLGHALKLADLAAAMTVEAMAGRMDAFRADVHELRPHPGQVTSAANIRSLLEGSSLANIAYDQIPLANGGWRWNGEMGRVEGGKAVKPQDSYSLRCAPQVHGAARDAYGYVASVVNIELNSVTDNPLVFPDSGDVVSAGNFHGMPLAIAASLLKSVIPTLASISERRLNKLVDPATNDGLPAFLVLNPDNTDSGFMIIQYTAAALVNDLASRAFPASVFSVPTSANTEDHVSMGANEARHVVEMLPDLLTVLSLELYTAAQAVEVRQKTLNGTFWKQDWLATADPARKTALQAHQAAVHGAGYQAGPAATAVIQRIRAEIPFLNSDRVLAGEVEAIVALASGPELVAAAEAVSGSLRV